MALFRWILSTTCCFLHIVRTMTGATTVGDFFLPLLQQQTLTCAENPTKTVLVESLQMCQHHCLSAFNSGKESPLSCTVLAFQRHSNNLTDDADTPPTLHKPYQCDLFATCGLVNYVNSSTSALVDLYQLNYFQMAANLLDTSAADLTVETVSAHAMYAAQMGQSTRATLLFLSVIRMLRQYEIDVLDGKAIPPTDERYVTKYRAFTNVGVLLLGSDTDGLDAKMGMRFYE